MTDRIVVLDKGQIAGNDLFIGLPTENEPMQNYEMNKAKPYKCIGRFTKKANSAC